MIQIHSTGTPVLASDLRVNDEVIIGGTVIVITHILPMAWSDSRRITGESVFGTERRQLPNDEIVNLAVTESLQNPATAMEIFLALREKGAI